MLNLMSNAVKYTLSGSITVAVHSGEAHSLHHASATPVSVSPRRT